MPRPKGSKNKAKPVVENVNEKIDAVEAEIEKLTTDLKAQKIELKKLKKAKEKANQVAAAKKAEEDRQKLLEAIEQSGKSYEEILELLK